MKPTFAYYNRHLLYNAVSPPPYPAWSHKRRVNDKIMSKAKVCNNNPVLASGVSFVRYVFTDYNVNAAA